MNQQKQLEKKIEYYLHLYYGCMMATFDRDGTRMKDHVNKAWLIDAYERAMNDDQIYYTYKFLLRRLDSQTREEQMEELNLLKSLGDERTGAESCALLTFNRLKKGFDLFQLIESGLALDESLTKIKS